MNEQDLEYLVNSIDQLTDAVMGVDTTLSRISSILEKKI